MKQRPMVTRARILMLVLVTVLCGGVWSAAYGAEYPEKPIKLVVPYPPGGSTDVAARMIISAAHMYLPQPFVVSNIGGAGGAIGTAEAAKAKPDGYTLLIGANATNTYIPLSQKVPYSKDSFIPIAQLTASPTIFGVLATSPYKTIHDLVDAAKKAPNTLKYSTAGVYSAHHVPTVLLSQKTGIKMKHIPYAGGPQAMTALLGGHVDLNPNFPTPFASQIKAGTIRPLAVSSSQRIKAYPDVKTLKELGIDVVVEQWQAVLAPKGTPDAIVKTLREAFRKICADKLYITMLEKMGEEVKYVDGEEFQEFWDKNWAETQELFASGVMTN
jgi:tripartite-type tricarboxylate transporter receptor subunit TctC